MTRALVLSGGGPVGIAWETGLTAGLAEEGVRIADADFIVGTSAGSFVGAQLAAGRDPAEMVEAQRARSEGGARPGAENQQPAPNPLALMQMMLKAYAPGGSPEQARLDLGKFALEAQTVPEESFIASFGRLPERWPAKRYACTAVDTADGSFHVWDNDSGVELARAIASSCSLPGVFPPITINGRRYMDGGMRSGSNADLAKDYDRVLVVTVRGAPPTNALPVQVQMAEVRQQRFEGELTAIREAGGEVEVIRPDDESAAAMGVNLMAYSARGAAVEAGLRQGRWEAGRLRDFWQP